jgi:hypothetical protein
MRRPPISDEVLFTELSASREHLAPVLDSVDKQRKADVHAIIVSVENIARPLKPRSGPWP